jgi:F-type H+-transporting ATPase subunit epsilon
MATFTFELVSPERMLFSGAVNSVIVPGAEGEFQVFAGHAPVMSTLRPGIVTVDGEDGRKRLFVRGGFADVNAGGLTILAQQAVAVEDIDRQRLAADIKDAEEDLADAKTDEARHKAADTLATLRDLLAAAAH